MRTVIRSLTLTLIAILIIFTSTAWSIETKWWLDEWSNPNDNNFGGSKIYLLTIGIVNGLSIYDEEVPINKKPFCLPEYFHNETLVGAIQVYVSKHPEAEDYEFNKTIGLALKELYPCQQSK